MSRKHKAETTQNHRILMESEVARQVRQHSRSSMKAEVCGVLIGKEEGTTTIVEACIAGVNAAQGGAHVTFTQDTWEHIYQIKDSKYPNDRIVGWYHSHPGFGVFLSDHDLFIHQNFFSSPQQIAWVYDPHTDEEGCFGWHEGKITKLENVAFTFGQSCDDSTTMLADPDEETAPIVEFKGSRSSVWRDTALCLLFFVLGIFATYYYIDSRALLFPRGERALVLVDGDKLAVLPPELTAAILREMQREFDSRMQSGGLPSDPSKLQQPSSDGAANPKGGQDDGKR